MKKMQDFNFFYWFLKSYVCFCFRVFYKNINVEGRQNIPKDKVVIFAPNHQNALMDALALLAVNSGEIVFLARADIFARKAVAKVLNFLKIMPVYRIRDGRDNLNKNTEIFDKSVDVLQDGKKLCLMPEGQQSFKRQLLPLVKGLCRIAFSAQEAIKDKEVVIIPVGIDYENYVNEGGDLIIRFGEALPLSAYMDVYTEDQARALNILRENLYKGISDLIQNIRSEKLYNLFYELSLMADSDICYAGRQKGTPIELFNARINISSALDEKAEHNQEEIDKLSADFDEYNRLLKNNSLQDCVIAKPSKKNVLCVKIFSMLISFPLFCFGWLANCIPAYMPLIIVNKFENESFKCSFKFVLWLISYTLYYLILLAVFGFVFQSVWVVLGAFLSFALFGYFTLKYRKWAKNIFTQVRYIFLNIDKKKKLVEKRNEIVNYILKIATK